MRRRSDRAHGKKENSIEKYASHRFDREAQGEKSVTRPTEKVMHAIDDEIAAPFWPRY